MKSFPKMIAPPERQKKIKEAADSINKVLPKDWYHISFVFADANSHSDVCGLMVASNFPDGHAMSTALQTISEVIEQLLRDIPAEN